MSPVVDATTEENRHHAVATAVEAVRAGKLVVIPTDTVYGVGCDAFDAESVTDLLAAKGRDRQMPPPVLIGDLRTVDGLASEVAPYVRDLIERFWPGPLTVILHAQPSLHWDLGETGGTVALRMPDDEIALELLREVGPMAVTSANRTGSPAATTVLDAATQLGSAIAVYVDGGPREESAPSTIVDCTGSAPIVLRPGAISEDDLAAVMPGGQPGIEAPGHPESEPEGDQESEAPEDREPEAPGHPETERAQPIE